MNQEVIYASEHFTDESKEFNHYSFSPSITKQRTIGGKRYTVRSYFAGGKDFAKTMQQLAVKQADKNAR